MAITFKAGTLKLRRLFRSPADEEKKPVAPQEPPLVEEVKEQKPVVEIDVPVLPIVQAEVEPEYVLAPKKEKPKKMPKMSITQLADLDAPPEHMDIKAWEQTVCMMKLERLFRMKMFDCFGVEVEGFMPTEKKQLKNFYTMIGDLEKALSIMFYVFDSWWAIKPRYRLSDSFPTPSLFCWQKFSRQIQIEHFKKTNVTRDEPKYNLDSNVKETTYERDF